MEQNFIEDQVVDAFIDIMDGTTWYALEAMTGMSESRCKEIENLFYELINNIKENKL
jgi:hypothetical protein